MCCTVDLSLPVLCCTVIFSVSLCCVLYPFPTCRVCCTVILFFSPCTVCCTVTFHEWTPTLTHETDLFLLNAPAVQTAFFFFSFFFSFFSCFFLFLFFFSFPPLSFNFVRAICTTAPQYYGSLMEALNELMRQSPSHWRYPAGLQRRSPGGGPADRHTGRQETCAGRWAGPPWHRCR